MNGFKRRRLVMVGTRLYMIVVFVRRDVFAVLIVAVAVVVRVTMMRMAFVRMIFMRM